MMSTKEVPIKENTSLNNLAGIGAGSRRQVDELDKEIIEVSCQRLMGVNELKRMSGY